MKNGKNVHTSKSEFNKNRFKNYEMSLKRVIKNAKIQYYSNEFFYAKNDIKRTWKTIKEALNKNKKSPSFPGKFRLGDEIFTDDKCISDRFNSFFANIGLEISNKIDMNNSDISVEHFLQNEIHSTFNFKHVSTSEVFGVLKRLKPKLSTGHDKLSTGFIKKISNEIAYPLTVLINDSLRKGIFPSSLKLAKVVPLHKKDSEDNFNNYRPISLLPAFSKIYENIVHLQLTE